MGPDPVREIGLKSALLKLLDNFSFFGAKYFSNRFSSGGVGPASVRVVQKYAYFRFSVHVAKRLFY